MPLSPCPHMEAGMTEVLQMYVWGVILGLFTGMTFGFACGYIRGSAMMLKSLTRPTEKV